MTASMENYLTELGAPQLKWITGTITSVDANKFVTLSTGGGAISNVAYLDQYTPVVGDRVHALSSDYMGILILGSSKLPVGGGGSVVPQTPLVVTASGRATYGPLPGQWTPSVLNQGPNLVASLFYNSFPSDRALEKVELQITRNDGGPIELVALPTNTAVGTPVMNLYPTWVPVTALPVGVPTWVTLPLGWGQDMLTGAIKGIGIVSSGQTGTYSGTGSVRLTPLSVTI